MRGAFVLRSISLSLNSTGGHFPCCLAALEHAPAAATAADSSVLAESMKAYSVFWTVCAVSGFVSISEAFLQPSSILSSTRECGALVCGACRVFPAQELSLLDKSSSRGWQQQHEFWYPSSHETGVARMYSVAKKERSHVATIAVRAGGGRVPCACLITRPSFGTRRRVSVALCLGSPADLFEPAWLFVERCV